jgi:diguanylate cyclase (GGDEF)-like protein
VSQRRTGPATAADAVAARPTVGCLSAELDDLENHQGHDVDAILARAVAVADEADRLGDIVLGHRARLVQADMDQRAGKVGEAARTFLTIHRWAELHDCTPLRARSHFHLALTYHYLGDHSASLEHALASVELLDDDAPGGLRIIFLIRLANSLAEDGSVDAARERYRHAEGVAVGIGDLTRQLLVLNNLAYTEFEADNTDTAWAVVDRMHSVASSLGRDFLIVERDTIANIQIGRGEYAAAEETLRAAQNAPPWYEAHNFADAALTLAHAQRRLGALDRAQASLDQCRALCAEYELAGVRVRAMAEQAELHAASGDHRSAFEEYKRYHGATEDLRSTQQEARSRARHAMFETAEARRDAERYREQARRDPLTGLYNRRFVDERMPYAIGQALDTTTPLTVALIDLDHFKRINDSFSHDVGDQVLVAVADLFVADGAGLPGGGFVARMGGEEFLVVLPGMTAEEALSWLDALRARVAGHQWRPLTQDITVTVSIGAAFAASTGGHTQASLLAEADRNLYAAKRLGRNRVTFFRPAAASTLT